MQIAFGVCELQTCVKMFVVSTSCVLFVIMRSINLSGCVMKLVGPLIRLVKPCLSRVSLKLLLSSERILTLNSHIVKTLETKSKLLTVSSKRVSLMEIIS